MTVNDTRSSTPQLDPVERYVPLLFKLSVYAFLFLFFYQAVDTFAEYKPGQQWPVLLSTFRMFTFLPIHEAGHFLFKFFGRTLNILGGSFWQIMFPFLWFLIALRQRSHVAPFALFWVGENIMDVSLYIRDAPLRWLPLLGGHASRHDWYNLLTDWGLLDSADTLADIAYYSGGIICLGAIATGLYLAVVSFAHPKPVVPERYPGTAPPVSALEDLLDESIEKKNRKPFHADDENYNRFQ